MLKQKQGIREFAQEVVKNLFGDWRYFGLFIIGVAIAGMFGNLCYEVVHDFSKWEELWKAWRNVALTIVGLSIVAFLLILLYYQPKQEKDRRKRMEEMLRPEREERMDFRYQGIIWLLSPGRESVQFARFGIVTHAQRGPLKFCWCIYSNGEDEDELIKNELEQRFNDLKEEIRNFCGERVQVFPWHIKRSDAEHTFEAIKQIYEDEIQTYGLSPHEVIADITGGFASMSAGMTLACSLVGAPVEYIQVKYLKDSEVYPSRQEQDWHHIRIDPRRNSPKKGKEAS